MFGIDNLIGDFLGSLNGAKYSGGGRGGYSGTRSKRNMYNVGYKTPTIIPNTSFIPSNRKSDSVRDAKEVMKYSGYDKFRF